MFDTAATGFVDIIKGNPDANGIPQLKSVFVDPVEGVGCGPYMFKMVVEFDPSKVFGTGCDAAKKTYTFALCSYTSLQFSVKDATISCSGQDFEKEVTVA